MIFRGEIYQKDDSGEMVLIISNNLGNKYSTIVEVLYLYPGESITDKQNLQICNAWYHTDGLIYSICKDSLNTAACLCKATEEDIEKIDQLLLEKLPSPDNRLRIHMCTNISRSGSLQRGNRPTVVLHNSGYTATVVFLTSRRKKNLPTHSKIHVVNDYSIVPSTALCEQIQTLPAANIGRYICALKDSEKKELLKSIKVSLGLISA